MTSIQLIVLDATGSRRLEFSSGLPIVEVKDGVSAAPEVLAEAMGQELGITGTILRVLGRNLLEVQLTGSDRVDKATLDWRPVADDPGHRLWWQRPGWMELLSGPLDSALADRGIRRTGPPVQVRYTSVTGLFQLPTNQGTLWLKTGPLLFAHEPAVISWVADTGVAAVPEVVVQGPGWWVARTFLEPLSTPVGDPLRSMAKVQLASVDRTAELIQRGCPDLPLERLPDDVADLAARRNLLTADESARLRAVLPALRSLCAQVGALGFPPALVHADLHPQNVQWTRDGWLLFDWTDSCVTHPFVELAMPLSYDTPAVRRTRAAAYAADWRRIMPADAVASALRAAPVIGAAHLAVSYRRILESIQHRPGDLPSSDDMVPWFKDWVHTLARSL
ncbi:aminoglycoside phosphotransferase family protein [Streptomyces sp. NBC_01298]|uniref:aminoglycoside phosphotransferase family protein n=1 Tax=Streptomyces sp. NBC_01298 TaxID=2903817 RepID=UPI002E1499DB|nr:aminoglycoside phosphotransferase family protein [Streptomyces sp. NBC_01298]